jgi:hypothetical protein
MELKTAAPASVQKRVVSPSFKLQQTSPLTSLVRQTSSSHRRARELAASEHCTPISIPTYQTATPFTPQYPSSPLLHSRFRSSTITSSSRPEDNSSYLDTSASFNDSHDAEYRYYDRESVYSNLTALLPSPMNDVDESWPAAGETQDYQQPWNGVSLDPNTHREHVPSPLPMVVVSSPESNYENISRKAPIVAPTIANFSRPVIRPSSAFENQKRQVLERNLGRALAPLAQSSILERLDPLLRIQQHPPSAAPGGVVSNVVDLPSSNSHLSPIVTPILRPSFSTPSLTTRHPPSPWAPPASTVAKKSYSHQQLDSTRSAASRLAFMVPSPAHSGSVISQERDSSVSYPALSDSPTSPVRTAQEYLLLGIQHHEANRLADSASCFEMSAKEQGGCGVGMLMWGLTLRHGWGCPKNEKQGFKWLQKAAESAVDDLESARGGREVVAVQVWVNLHCSSFA